MNRTELIANLAQPWEPYGSDMVAPAILIKAGVACGNRGCILHPAETIEKSARFWNGVPVTMRHPMKDGQPVSVNESTETFNNYVIGKISNARFERGELRADIIVTSRDPSIRSLVQRSKEVSVGIFADDMPAEGRFRGKSFSSIAQFYRPDHLAVLPDEVGACSWEDGCGIRLNVADRWLREMAGKAILLLERQVTEDMEGAGKILLPPEVEYGLKRREKSE